MKYLLFTLCAFGWSITATAQTTYPLCGNSIIDSGEFCDDGNNLDGDICSSNCLFGAPPSAPLYAKSPTPSREDPNQYKAYPTLMNKPAHAFGLSLASTLLTGGAIPSLGHMYAGEYRRAIASWGIRMAGGITALLGASILIASSFNEDLQACPSTGLGCGVGAIYLGLGAFTGTLIFDIVDAPRAALRSNEKGLRPWHLGVAPIAMPTLGGGLSLRLKF
jgi:cysteine-rich repeat protein